MNTPPTSSKTFKEIVADHPVVVFCTGLIVAFVAGISAYKGLLEITNQETVIKGSYVLIRDIKPGDASSQDDGAERIKSFYVRLNERKFADAWSLIHRARKDEIQRYLPDAQSFGETYATTLSHDNIRVVLNKRSDTEASYQVSFDVNDSFPRSSFYEYQGRLVKEMFETGLLNRAKTLETAFRDIGMHYVISDQDGPVIEKMIEDSSVDYLLSPLFVAEVARKLHLVKGATVLASPNRNVWRHVILQITLMPEDGHWKIRRGLFPPEAVGLYAVGAKVPAN